MKAPQKSLKKWTKQKWRTKSGKPSAKTGERYLPEAAIKSLSSAEYAATTKAKREGTKAGKQFVKQPKSIAKKTAKFRAAEGGMAKKPMSSKEIMGLLSDITRKLHKGRIDINTAKAISRTVKTMCLVANTEMAAFKLKKKYGKAPKMLD